MAENAVSTLEVGSPNSMNSLTISNSPYVIMDIEEPSARLSSSPSPPSSPTSPSSPDHNYSMVREKPAPLNLNYSTVSMEGLDGVNPYTEVKGAGDLYGQITSSRKTIVYFVAIVISILALAVIFSCIVAVFLKIADLEAQVSFLQQSVLPGSEQGSTQATTPGEEVSLRLQEIDVSLARIQDTLGEFEFQGNVTMQHVDELAQGLVSFQQIFLGQFDFYPATSCGDLLPSSPPDYYWIKASNGSAVEIFCDELSIQCGGVSGEWRRVAALDMTNTSQQCPDSLVLYNDSDRRTCVIDTGTEYGLCSSVTYSTDAVEFSKVCGRIVAYQFGSPDSFGGTIRGPSPSINTFYVDGVSLTHGSPRQHIWTFAAAGGEIDILPDTNCPCINSEFASEAAQPPAFVGSNYFCDTGSVSGHLPIDDPLWDGAGCGPLNTCCSFNSPPWFSRLLPQPTTDDIEMRVCRDQEYFDENIAIEIVEIFVQ